MGLSVPLLAALVVLAAGRAAAIRPQTPTTRPATTVPTIVLLPCSSVPPPSGTSWASGGLWDVGLSNLTLQAHGVSAPAPEGGPSCLSATPPTTTAASLHSCRYAGWPEWRLDVDALRSPAGGTIAMDASKWTKLEQGGVTGGPWCLDGDAAKMTVSLSPCSQDRQGATSSTSTGIESRWQLVGAQMGGQIHLVVSNGTKSARGSLCLAWGAGVTPPPTPGTFTVNVSAHRQTIWGLGYEIQSDSIGSGNHGLPNGTASVPHDLTPSEAQRFFTSMLPGFRFCRLALGLYLRGLDPSRRFIRERFPGQMAGLKAMQDVSGIDGFAAEYWSPAPFWKAAGSYVQPPGASLASFNESFLHNFGNATAADVLYLYSSGLRVPWWGLQNEPGAHPSYSSCNYNTTQYHAAFRAAASQVRALSPAPKVHVSSWSGPTGLAAQVASDPTTAAMVDMWTYHFVGRDSSSPMQEARTLLQTSQGKPVVNNEFEYFYGSQGHGNDQAHSTVNTAQMIMNWMTFVGSPTFYWLHALKPTYNSESVGYGLGFWRPWDDNNTDCGHFPDLEKGHWQYNMLNWPSLAGFVTYMPWDSVRVDVLEDEQRQDQRVMAFLTPNGTLDEGVGGPRHAWKTPPGLLGVIVTNRNTQEPFNVSLVLGGVDTGTIFCGHRYNRTAVDVPLGGRSATAVPEQRGDSQLSALPAVQLTLPPNAIEFWLQSSSGACDGSDAWWAAATRPLGLAEQNGVV